MALVGRKAQPFQGFGIILRHAIAVQILVAKTILRFWVSSFGREEIPIVGRVIVLLHTVAKIMSGGQFKHRLDIALVGRILQFAELLGRHLFGLLLFQLFQFFNRIFLALLRRLAIPFERGSFVALHTESVFI